MCPWYNVDGKWSQEQWIINIKSCVKTGKSASKTLALLTRAYGKYAMKIMSVFDWHMWFKEG
jgi:hypothetical protein